MSRPPADDRPLTDFLQQHRPSVPPASPDLEDRLMTAVLDTPPVVPVPVRRPVARRVLWVFPAAIAAGLVALVSYPTLFPPQPSEAQLAELETFIESTWQDTVAEQPDTDAEELYPLVETGVN